MHKLQGSQYTLYVQGLGPLPCEISRVKANFTGILKEMHYMFSNTEGALDPEENGTMTPLEIKELGAPSSESLRALIYQVSSVSIVHKIYHVITWSQCISNVGT